MLFPTLLLAVVAQAAPQFGGSQGFTMLRFGCAQNVIDRIDPLVNPGQAPSPHMHQVVGGNAFNISMQSTDISKLATCTTCGYSEDVSQGDEYEAIEADGLGDSFPTTGPRTSTSRPVMERTNAYLKFPTGTSSYQKSEFLRTDLNEGSFQRQVHRKDHWRFCRLLRVWRQGPGHRLQACEPLSLCVQIQSLTQHAGFPHAHR